MSGNEIAALIVAVTGALGAIFAGVRNLRGDRFKKEVEASAALLAGYTSMVASLQKEIDRLKTDHTNDRAAWVSERASMREEHIAEITRLRRDQQTELKAANERIDELGSQVYVLQHRPPSTRDRSSDDRR